MADQIKQKNATRAAKRLAYAKLEQQTAGNLGISWGGGKNPLKNRGNLIKYKMIERARTCFYLWADKGMEYREIAKMKGICYETVRQDIKAVIRERSLIFEQKAVIWRVKILDRLDTLLDELETLRNGSADENVRIKTITAEVNILKQQCDIVGAAEPQKVEVKDVTAATVARDIVNRLQLKGKTKEEAVQYVVNEWAPDNGVTLTEHDVIG